MGSIGRRIEALERLYGEPLVNEALARERQEEAIGRLESVIRQEGGDPKAPLTEEEEEGLRELVSMLDAIREEA